MKSVSENLFQRGKLKTFYVRRRIPGSVALTFKKTSLSRYDFLYYRWTDYACQCIKLVCK